MVERSSNEAEMMFCVPESAKIGETDDAERDRIDECLGGALKMRR